MLLPYGVLIYRKMKTSNQLRLRATVTVVLLLFWVGLHRTHQKAANAELWVCSKGHRNQMLNIYKFYETKSHLHALGYHLPPQVLHVLLSTPDRTTYVSGASPVIYDRTSSSFHSNISNPPVIRNSRLLSGSVNYIKTIPTNSVVGVVPPTPVTVNRVQPVGYTAASKHRLIPVAKVATPALQEVRRFEAHPIAVSQVVNFDAANRKVEPAVEIKHV